MVKLTWKGGCLGDRVFLTAAKPTKIKPDYSTQILQYGDSIENAASNVVSNVRLTPIDIGFLRAAISVEGAMVSLIQYLPLPMPIVQVLLPAMSYVASAHQDLTTYNDEYISKVKLGL